jgi:hypothetical protein
MRSKPLFSFTVENKINSVPVIGRVQFVHPRYSLLPISNCFYFSLHWPTTSKSSNGSSLKEANCQSESNPSFRNLSILDDNTGPSTKPLFQSPGRRYDSSKIAVTEVPQLFWCYLTLLAVFIIFVVFLPRSILSVWYFREPGNQTHV